VQNLKKAYHSGSPRALKCRVLTPDMLWAMDESLRNDNEMTARKLKDCLHEQFIAAHKVTHFTKHLPTPMTEIVVKYTDGFVHT